MRRAGLRRVLANLIENAFKHGSKVAVSLTQDERLVEIAVEDNGPGIPEPRREEAFRPFHRQDEGRNLQSGGSGLGLAIARDIARAHGGDIVLSESPLGGLKATGCGCRCRMASLLAYVFHGTRLKWLGNTRAVLLLTLLSGITHRLRFLLPTTPVPVACDRE